MARVHDGGEAYEQLGSLYDAWCAEVEEDLPFYVDLAAALARELGRPRLDVVELGAGSGRITAALADAGHSLTAIDASPSQLERLRARVGDGAGVRSLLGDMRAVGDLLEAASADLVLVPFRGMLHVTADRAAVLDGARSLLRPGGVLAFDVFHPSAEQVAATDGVWLHRRDEPTTSGRWRFRERARYLPDQAAEPGGLKLEVDVEARWRPVRRRGTAQGPVWADPDPGAERERSAVLELQLVPASRWQCSIRDAGLELDGAYGWFDARPLDDDADDSIWVARRR